MVASQFQHVRGWVFDLDNTLYPPEAALFDQIEVKMTDWVMQELNTSRQNADRLRKQYWRDYGTTLAGLMAEHDVDPGPYLTHVHEIDMTHLKKDPVLATAISALPGKRIVYTNGSAPYARRVLAARGLTEVIDAVYGIEHANFAPKPNRIAFETILATANLSASTAAMFEDDARNLQAPHEMGMKTIHVAPASGKTAYIQHHTTDLSGFLTSLIPAARTNVAR